MLYFDHEPRAGLPPSECECTWPVDFVADTLQGEIIKQALDAAQDAKTVAEAAQKKTEAASASVESAKDEALSAQIDAESANAEAQEAKTVAVTARDEAVAANSAAQSVKDTVLTARDEAVTANTDAQSAKTAAETAQGKAEAAQTAAETARSAAETAQENAESASSAAQSAKTTAEDNSLLAKSWAVGDTGKRTDENTNNAKYWASVAEAVSSGGVLTFNGRTGAVVPKSGDYTADMVGADATGTAAAAAGAVQSNLDTHTGNTTVHITSTERTNWNAKADEADLTSHVGDEVKHITAEERTGWNAKADESALTDHTGNTTVHITGAERTAWNAKADATDLTSHTGSSTIHVTAASKSEWDGKVSGSTKVNTTLSASGWTSDNKYTLSNSNITATSAVELLPRENSGITQAQMEALSGAMIVGGTQAAGSIQLIALGDTPTIDIPVTLIIRRDL